MTCGMPAPDHPSVLCSMPEGQHPWHSGVVPGSVPPEPVDWRAEEYIAPVRARSKSQRAEHKAKLTKIMKSAYLNVRSSDPAQAHEAARRFEPKRGTRKAQALALLRVRRGEWIDAPEFTHEHTGGFSGTRRVRELREEGWPIEIRPRPDSENTWQYRLSEEV